MLDRLSVVISVSPPTTFYARILDSDLGKIYIAVPWDDLVAVPVLRQGQIAFWLNERFLSRIIGGT